MLPSSPACLQNNTGVPVRRTRQDACVLRPCAIWHAAIWHGHWACRSPPHFCTQSKTHVCCALVPSGMPLPSSLLYAEQHLLAPARRTTCLPVSVLREQVSLHGRAHKMMRAQQLCAVPPVTNYYRLFIAYDYSDLLIGAIAVRRATCHLHARGGCSRTNALLAQQHSAQSRTRKRR